MESEKGILLLFAHPAFERSRVNKELLKAAKSVPGVYAHDLYEHYPDIFIDVEKEQNLLKQYSRIVWQHPFYWYSAPALLKQWFDMVLTHGWAYGKNGTALRGKSILHVITTGGPRSAYTSEGNNHYTMHELTLPFRQTANLCGMNYSEPYIVYGSHKLDKDAIEEAARKYKAALQQFQLGFQTDDSVESNGEI